MGGDDNSDSETESGCRVGVENKRGRTLSREKKRNKTVRPAIGILHRGNEGFKEVPVVPTVIVNIRVLLGDNMPCWLKSGDGAALESCHDSADTVMPIMENDEILTYYAFKYIFRMTADVVYNLINANYTYL